jgi:hypothetical protein
MAQSFAHKLVDILRRAVGINMLLQRIENLDEAVRFSIEGQASGKNVTGKELGFPGDYTSWMQSITGIPLKTPNFFPAMSWSLDTQYGQHVNKAMVEAEAMCVKELLAEQQRNKVKGAIVEFGVFQGAWLERLYLACEELKFQRDIYGFDSFEGLPEPEHKNDLGGWKKGDYSATYDSVCADLKVAERPNIHLVPGWFSDSLPRPETQAISEICFARIDCDLYAPALECLRYLAPRLVNGSILVFDDWTFATFKGETKAFAEWLPEVPNLKFQFLFFTSIGHFYFKVLRP